MWTLPEVVWQWFRMRYNVIRERGGDLSRVLMVSRGGYNDGTMVPYAADVVDGYAYGTAFDYDSNVDNSILYCALYNMYRSPATAPSTGGNVRFVLGATRQATGAVQEHVPMRSLLCHLWKLWPLYRLHWFMQSRGERDVRICAGAFARLMSARHDAYDECMANGSVVMDPVVPELPRTVNFFADTSMYVAHVRGLGLPVLMNVNSDIAYVCTQPRDGWVPCDGWRTIYSTDWHVGIAELVFQMEGAHDEVKCARGDDFAIAFMRAYLTMVRIYLPRCLCVSDDVLATTGWCSGETWNDQDYINGDCFSRCGGLVGFIADLVMAGCGGGCEVAVPVMWPYGIFRVDTPVYYSTNVLALVRYQRGDRLFTSEMCDDDTNAIVVYGTHPVELFECTDDDITGYIALVRERVLHEGLAQAVCLFELYHVRVDVIYVAIGTSNGGLVVSAHTVQHATMMQMRRNMLDATVYACNLNVAVCASACATRLFDGDIPLAHQWQTLFLAGGGFPQHEAVDVVLKKVPRAQSMQLCATAQRVFDGRRTRSMHSTGAGDEMATMFRFVKLPAAGRVFDDGLRRVWGLAEVDGAATTTPDRVNVRIGFILAPPPLASPHPPSPLPLATVLPSPSPPAHAITSVHRSPSSAPSSRPSQPSPSARPSPSPAPAQPPVIVLSSPPPQPSSPQQRLPPGGSVDASLGGYAGGPANLHATGHRGVLLSPPATGGGPSSNAGNDALLGGYARGPAGLRAVPHSGYRGLLPSPPAMTSTPVMGRGPRPPMPTPPSPLAMMSAPATPRSSPAGSPGTRMTPSQPPPPMSSPLSFSISPPLMPASMRTPLSFHMPDDPVGHLDRLVELRELDDYGSVGDINLSGGLDVVTPYVDEIADTDAMNAPARIRHTDAEATRLGGRFTANSQRVAINKRVYKAAGAFVKDVHQRMWRRMNYLLVENGVPGEFLGAPAPGNRCDEASLVRHVARTVNVLANHRMMTTARWDGWREPHVAGRAESQVPGFPVMSQRVLLSDDALDVLSLAVDASITRLNDELQMLAL